MAIVIAMPKLGLEMETGTVVEWHKKEGDEVAKGEVVLLIATEKINFEIEAEEAGVLRKMLASPDEELPVGAPLGIIGGKDEAIDEAALLSAQTALVSEPGSESAPAPVSVPVRESPPLTGTSPQASPAASPRAREGGKIRISPRARRLAEERGIDLASVTPSGPGGRILEEDVRKVLEAGTAQAKAGRGLEVLRRIPLRGIRKTVAERMRESLDRAAQVTLTAETDVTEAVRWRERVRVSEDWQKRYGPVPRYDDLILRAVALALRNHPRLNSSLIDKEIEEYKEVNVGFAVALEEGLMVPVIRNADGKSLAEIAQESVRLAEKARNGTLTLEEVGGGTFSITNLGAWGVDFFTPIINVPQCAILGVGRIAEKPLVVNKKVEIRKVLPLSLVFDHRIVDGAPAAAFLAEIRKYLEHPEEILL